MCVCRNWTTKASLRITSSFIKQLGAGKSFSSWPANCPHFVTKVKNKRLSRPEEERIMVGPFVFHTFTTLCQKRLFNFLTLSITAAGSAFQAHTALFSPPLTKKTPFFVFIISMTEKTELRVLGWFPVCYMIAVLIVVAELILFHLEQSRRNPVNGKKIIRVILVSCYRCKIKAKKKKKIKYKQWWREGLEKQHLVELQKICKSNANCFLHFKHPLS